MNARHGAARRRALADLSSVRYTRLLDALDHLPDAVDGKRAHRPAPNVLVSEIRRSHRRMRRRLHSALDASGDDHLLHETRKAAKRVRYAAESATGVLGSRVDKLAARMEQAQETLGAHQDTVVIRDVLRGLATDADANDEASFTYGRLHTLEEQRADAARTAFLEMVDEGFARRPGWLY
jgi:CHAD domain-containing protein